MDFILPLIPPAPPKRRSGFLRHKKAPPFTGGAGCEIYQLEIESASHCSGQATSIGNHFTFFFQFGGKIVFHI